MEELRTALTAVAVAVSLGSLYFTRRFWLQSNRPIVTATVVEYASGNMGAVFNLIVSNTGNRPATNVRLKAKPGEIDKLIVESVPVKDERRLSIHSCFSDKSTIPLLRNGEELTTAFGSFSKAGSNEECLNYGAVITTAIAYEDIEGRSYRSIVMLKVHSREGFGGSVWK